VAYTALVPNQEGLERALRARVDKIAVFATSETFSRKNTNHLDHRRSALAPVIEQGTGARLYLDGVSLSLRRSDRTATSHRSQALCDLGCDELSIGDTIGKATPEEVTGLFEQLLADRPTINWPPISTIPSAAPVPTPARPSHWGYHLDASAGSKVPAPARQERNDRRWWRHSQPDRD
jgi:isopropylmalate/homocitrate/citramalate synthase